MMARPPITCGFVPSLEAMPLLAHPLGLKAGGDPWHFMAFPSYGRILRNLLTGELAAGLVPWELFVTEVLARPGQKHLWAVPLVIHACPTELVLSHRAKKLMSPIRPKGKAKAAASSAARLIFAIEARRSLTKLQIAAWLNKTLPSALESSQFKMLPMDLMLKGLEAGEIDGLVAPTPWGLLAESLGHGSVDASFTQGEFSQEVVLVCQRRAVEVRAAVFRSLPSSVTSARKQLLEPAVFAATAAAMRSSGGPAVDLALLEQAAAMHLPHASPHDFAPNSSFLLQILQHLAKFSLLQSSLGDLNALSRDLAL